MRRVFFSIGLLRIAIAAALLAAPHVASADVLKVVVDGTINPISAEHVERSIQEAERIHADALLMEMNTPGGIMGPMEQIIQKVLASPVPVIIYVTPAGSDAGSAGFFILEAADVAAMAPGTHAGAAHPVRGDGVAMDPVMKEKAENYATSLLRSYVGKRGPGIQGFHRR
jgi:membrane-bound serine protease (ClpP class)